MFNPKTKTDDYMFMIVTHECNRKCPFCVDEKRGLGEFIEMDSVYKGLEWAKENNIKTITVLGGEPTLHPKIRRICYLIKQYGFELVMTTNADDIYEVEYLDRYVDSFNISHYGQEDLPESRYFDADLTLSKLLFKGGLDTKEKLDDFIEMNYSKYDALKFSTLTNINEFTNINKDLDYLNHLPIEKKVTIMGEIEGHYYRGCLIKRFDIPATENTYSKRSMKIHTNGEIKREW